MKTSSVIAGIRYNRAHEMLVVDFHNGSRYRYRGVNPERAERLRHASSVGHAFNTLVRDRFPTERVQ
ncbi:MAG: KTSC domain-containing protein [Actinobacteria bacterium]|nr:KTSC domain-containing protein [Actinomycetota bacterium]